MQFQYLVKGYLILIIKISTYSTLLHWSLIPNLMLNALNSFDDGAIVSAPQSGVDHLINLLGVYTCFFGGERTPFFRNIS